MLNGGAVNKITTDVCNKDAFKAGAEKGQCEALVQVCGAKGDDGVCTDENIDSNVDGIKLALITGDAAGKAAFADYDNIVSKLKGLVSGGGAADADDDKPVKPVKPPKDKKPTGDEDDEDSEPKLSAKYNAATVCKKYDDVDDRFQCKQVAKLAKAFCNSSLKERHFTEESETLANYECGPEEMKGHITVELQDAINEFMTIDADGYDVVRGKILAKGKASPHLDNKGEVADFEKYALAISEASGFAVNNDGPYVRVMVGSSITGATVNSKRGTSGVGEGCPDPETLKENGIDPSTVDCSTSTTNFSKPSEWAVPSLFLGVGAGYFWNVGGDRVALGLGAELTRETLTATDSRSADMKAINANFVMSAKGMMAPGLSLRLDFLLGWQNLEADTSDSDKQIIDGAGERIAPSDLNQDSHKFAKGLDGLGLGAALSVGLNITENHQVFGQIRYMNGVDSTYDKVGKSRTDQAYDELVLPADSRVLLTLGYEFDL